MQVKYLETSALGLRWMRTYYQKNPQLNRANALKSLRKAEEILADFPYSGELYEDFEVVREYPLYATAFSLLYTFLHETVWIIDIRDQRGNRSADALRDFNREVRLKHGLAPLPTTREEQI
jgi:hypothetical protein